MKLKDFTEALENKYIDTSTSSRILNESYEDDWYDEGEKYSLVGQDGNAFALMGYTARCMKECGLRNEISEMRERATSSDYNNLICVCDEYVQRCNEIAKGMNESCKIEESVNDWEISSDQNGEFLFKEWPNGFNAQIYLPDENYDTFHVNICKDYDDYLQDLSKEFDSLEKAKEYVYKNYKNLSESLNESEEKWIPLNKIPVYGNVADGYECNQKAEVRNARTGRKYKAVSSNGGYFDLKYTVKLKNGKSTSIAKDKLDQEIKDSFVFSNLGETDTK